MNVLSIRNVHQALPEALYQIALSGVRRESRNGPVLVMPNPVTTCYHKPRERVVFWPQRDANPFFHLFEALWMLGGRNDVAFPAQFAGNIVQYSDDGETLHGAYGHRWTEHFRATGSLQSWTGRIDDSNRKDGILDQLGSIVEVLRQNPNDRRCVLTMWDPPVDLGMLGKDFPCNTHAYFQINFDGELDMTVCCRSNDIVWGCYGANAVHFSILQEYMAARIGVPVGRYWQVSNNWHLYLDQHEELMDELCGYAVMPPSPRTCPYSRGLVDPFPLVGADVEAWDRDLDMFLDEGTEAMGYKDPFFRRVALPMLQAWHLFKSDPGPEVARAAFDHVRHNCHASDWALAAKEWLIRKEEARIAKRP